MSTTVLTSRVLTRRARRRRSVVVIAGVLAAASGTALASPAQASDGGDDVVRFRVAMNGLNEVDTVGSSGTATIRLTLDRGDGQVCFSNLRQRGVFAAGESAPTKLHIHAGVPSINGPVVIDFTDLVAQGKRRGCLDVEPQLIDNIVNAPNSYYVNVHTATFPGGAVRGQIDQSRNPRLPRNATSYEVSTSGANEVGVVGSENGTGRFTVLLGDGRACVVTRELRKVFIREDEFAPTSLHIHRGAAGANGDVVIDFSDETNFGQRVGCVDVDQALIDEINADPAGFYLNFHTISFPKGAMRGQLA